ncbi:HEPN domain-containing protein [Peribacillus simplex]|uniref:HEPN domain-containing protein n=1 Tax=Peribacillus simplex TaxID=1478 RepID=UPI000BA52727|nr:HEPN domain-containing protein [Peribacillus simplex]PAK36782.1 hypothetical protein CHI08_23635 [Peribacillus simplex]
MDYNKALSMIKDLLARVEQGTSERKDGESCIRYGMGEDALTFRGTENVTAFNDTVDFLWTKDKELMETITRKTLQDELVRLIRTSVNNEELTLDRVKELFNNLKNEPVKTFEVLYHVYGVEYYKGHPLEIGPYTIYNTDIHRKVLLEKYQLSKDTLEFELSGNKVTSKVMIGVSERTRDFARANQKALVRLRQFEDTIRFLIGDPAKNYDVGIFNFNALKRTGGIVLSHQKSASTSNMSGTIDKILLHQFPIDNPEYGHDKLWEMLKKDNPTKLEQRIISAIAWAGKALRDEEPARALTQYVFALEALLQFQQRGSMVSPSITYQMTEFAAFIIANDLNSRLNIEKMIKNVYGRRSAIAHGGSHEVSDTDLYDALFLLKYLITTLTTNEAFKDFKTIEEVSEWVKIKKYS